MFFWLMACTEPCRESECSCPQGEGTLLIENVAKASLHIPDQKDKSKGTTIVCTPDKEGVLCSFTPSSALIHAEILLADKAFPVEIQSNRQSKEDCCQCEYYQLTPSRVSIPYR